MTPRGLLNNCLLTVHTIGLAEAPHIGSQRSQRAWQARCCGVPRDHDSFDPLGHSLGVKMLMNRSIRENKPNYIVIDVSNRLPNDLFHLKTLHLDLDWINDRKA